jgi:hypothetical protein
VELIVHDVGAGNELRDDVQAIALIHAGVAFDLLPRDRRLGGGGRRLQRSFLAGYLHRFMRAGRNKLKVKQGRTSTAPSAIVAALRSLAQSRTSLVALTYT